VKDDSFTRDGVPTITAVDVRSTRAEARNSAYYGTPTVGTVNCDSDYEEEIYYQPTQLYKSVKVKPFRKGKVPFPNERPRTFRPNYGAMMDKTKLGKPDVSGRLAAAMDKLFRSKSQNSNMILKLLQISLIGHTIKCDHYYPGAAAYLRTNGEYVKVHNKPSFAASRLILNSIKDSISTSYKLPSCIRHRLSASYI
jgi:hypothetical protein